MENSDGDADEKPFVCAGFALLSGFCMTLAAISVAYPNYKSTVQKVEQGTAVKFCGLILNLISTGATVALGAVASWYGPLSISFPISVAANLLSNMLLQSAIGMATYTKNMRVGTLVLAASVTILLDIGPSDLPKEVQRDNSRMIQMLTAPPSLFYILLSTIIMVTCLTLLKQKRIIDNDMMVFAYALVGCSGTVINNSLAKLLVVNLDDWVKWVMFGFYVVIAAICLGVAALANGTLEDPSKFVPVGAGVNLVLTCLAGLCIWGDGYRIRYPLAYGMVYVLIVLGVYDISTFGFGGSPEAATLSFLGQQHVLGQQPIMASGRNIAGQNARSLPGSTSAALSVSQRGLRGESFELQDCKNSFRV